MTTSTQYVPPEPHTRNVSPRLLPEGDASSLGRKRFPLLGDRRRGETGIYFPCAPLIASKSGALCGITASQKETNKPINNSSGSLPGVTKREPGHAGRKGAHRVRGDARGSSESSVYYSCVNPMAWTGAHQDDSRESRNVLTARGWDGVPIFFDRERNRLLPLPSSFPQACPRPDRPFPSPVGDTCSSGTRARVISVRIFLTPTDVPFAALLGHPVLTPTKAVESSTLGCPGRACRGSSQLSVDFPRAETLCGCHSADSREAFVERIRKG